MTRTRRITVLSFGVIIVTILAVSLPHFGRDSQRIQLTAKCRESYQRRRWDELQSLAEPWSKWDSQNGEPWMFLGHAASGRRDWAAAVASYSRVPETHPGFVPAMIQVSELSFEHLNDPLKGVDACHRILKVDPLAAGAQRQLIWYYAMTLQRAKLLQQIESAVKAQREPREAYAYYFLADSFRTKFAVKLNQRWQELAPDEEVFQVARVLHLPSTDADSPVSTATAPDGDQTQPAISRSKRELLEDLLVRFPHNIELLANLAQDRLSSGDAVGAAALLPQAPAAAEHDSRFWSIQGWLHELNNDLEKATAAYRRALELHAMDWNTLNRLAVVERRRQNQDEVQRLTTLVERAYALRKQLRELPAIEKITPEILRELASLADDCGDQKIGPALKRRFATIPSR